jgi:ubiquinone/menaquinone biosynthesis C-methylase UbiE
MKESINDKAHWARFAEEWVAWARSAHDVFWKYRCALSSFVGSGTGHALELGCGEGRISRELKKLGYRVTATDAVAALVEASRQANSADEYAVADGKELPFEDGQFDLVVAYNVLMDVEDVPATLKEMRRVMKSNGTVFISLVHPFRERGCFSGNALDAPFVLNGSYYGRARFKEVEEYGGLRMHFAGWSQPLENYAAALEDVGLAITSLREPIPDETTEDRLKQWTRIPLFLWLKARILKTVDPQLKEVVLTGQRPQRYSPSSRRAPSQNSQQRRYTSLTPGALAGVSFARSCTLEY